MKKKILWLLLAPLAFYIVYVGIGITLLAIGRTDKWVVLPNKVIAKSNVRHSDSSTMGTDGPHIFYQDGHLISKQIVHKDTGLAVVFDRYSSRDQVIVHCTFSDHPEWSFATRLKPQLSIEPAEYELRGDLLAISDIEGEFGAFRKLLIASKVMNERYEWTWNKGHLVLVGDFFDRGLQVTETLWLIYHLEQQAEQAGGKVHFVLGNHELMNMGDDIRYVREKYVRNAVLLNAAYRSWFKPGTELGRWLGTKNITERIGPVLFVHGGFSKGVTGLPHTLTQINEACRPWYFADDSTKDAALQGALKLLMNSSKGPYWYRGLVTGDVSSPEVDDLLKKYNAETIVVGHTVVERVTKLYGGRVFAIDVRHAEGVSQALLLREGQFYRIDDNGQAEIL